MSNKPKQVAILGLGIFGSTLAETLEDFGVEVLAVDIDPVCVSRIKDNVTKALDINTFDVAVVAISKHFEEAVSCTLLLKELNVPYVIAKARTKRKKIILEKVGADRVINTEKEMAYKLAKHLLRRSIVDLVELDEEYSIVEIRTLKDWEGKSLSNVNIRRVYGMNVVGIKPQGSPKMTMDFSADYIIQPGDHFLVVSKTKEVEKWDFLTKE
mgnify:CR=1 FL=1